MKGLKTAVIIALIAQMTLSGPTEVFAEAPVNAGTDPVMSADAGAEKSEDESDKGTNTVNITIKTSSDTAVGEAAQTKGKRYTTTVVTDGKKTVTTTTETDDKSDLSKTVDNSTTVGNNEEASLQSVSSNDYVADNDYTPTTTNPFIMVGGDWITPVAYAGSTINVVLPVVNMSTTHLNDVIVTPVVAGNTDDWPFEIDTSGYTQTIPDLPGRGNGQNDMDRRRELTWTFRVRRDVLNGYYKVPYNVIYYTPTGYETTTLTTWVKAVGLEGAGNKDDGGKGTSVPRVIITGFDTEPKDVYAGNTFTLTLHLQNTSKRTPVSNMQIDLTTPTAGKDSESTYEAFLPTSGSNTLYIDKIGTGGYADVSIEMTAKADLSNKPYQIAVNMAYEDKDFTAYTTSANVSIPINQEARFEIGEPEVMPSDISVGEQSNVMFSIFNTGKTTLYNVQVKFEGASVNGGDTFVGKLESGATGNVDAMINGVAPTADDGMVKAVVYYEDEAGNVYDQAKEFQLFVSEGFDEDEMMYSEDMMDGEEPQGGKKIWIILIILFVIVAAIITTVIILVKHKKKKAEKELRESLEEDLEEEDPEEEIGEEQEDVVEEDEEPDGTKEDEDEPVSDDETENETETE